MKFKTIDEAIEAFYDLRNTRVCDRIKHVWWDADMVLVDAVDYIGSRIHPYHNTLVEGDAVGNLDKVNRMPRAERNVVFNEYYTAYPRTFSQLETLPDFKVLMAVAVSIMEAGILCGVLTTVDNRHPCQEVIRADKTKNLHEHVLSEGAPMRIQLVDSHKGKDLYAGPGVILIDDYKRNTDGFTTHGGVGILHTHHDTLGTLNKLYDAILA